MLMAMKKAMSAVRGGEGYGYPSSSYFSFMPIYAPNNSKTVNASQVINTSMYIESVNGNNPALVAGININPRVESSNNIYMP